MKEKNFFIYKYLNAQGQIIYIGQTIDIRNRVWQHNEKTDKIYSEIKDIYYYRCKHKTEMDAYEYFLIRKHHPKYNCVFNNESNCYIDEPEWILYQAKNFQKSKDLRRKRKGKAILCIETGIIYTSGRDAEAKLGIHHTNIYGVCSGKRKTAGGYHWRYLNEGKN